MKVSYSFIAPAGIVSAALLVFAALVPLRGLTNTTAEDDRRLYDSACASCHGNDGRGRTRSQVAFDTELPDFADCEFASREPSADWEAIVHQGGPVRGFDRMMPAFGDALSNEEIEAIVRHVKTFCTDDSWPPGEFNLPRALYTGKVHVEDETVFQMLANPEGNGSFLVGATYEKRIGSRANWEFKFPLEFADVRGDGHWKGGVGDLQVGLKYIAHHNLAAGNISAIGAEVRAPTGDPALGFSKDSWVIEPYYRFAQLLPADAFLQLHTQFELATSSKVEDEFVLRANLGKTWTQGEFGFGRAWSPMLGVLASRDLTGGADTNIDVVPQMQVSVNKRQHILFNLGVRLPVNHTTGRDIQIAAYLIWDWYDGGFTDGW